MAHKITLIPGDGIGTEVTQAVVRILEATGVKFEWETYLAGAEAFEKYHEYIPKELIESIERTHVGLKGPIGTPVGGGFASINVQLRKKFELYANFRPIQNLPHVPTRYPDVDLIIVRENTESLYSGIEHEVVPGVVESLKIITEKASTRIAKFAFAYAKKNQRKKIHAIHKANIMKLSDGLFLRGVCRRARPCAQREFRRAVRDFRGCAWLGAGHCGEKSGQPHCVAAFVLIDVASFGGARCGGEDSCGAGGGLSQS